MAAQTRNRYARQGRGWLASAAPDPVAVHRAWKADDLAEIPTGRHWLAAEVNVYRSIDAMQRFRPADLGPVLVYPEAGLAWWLVPLDAAEHLADIRSVIVHVPGWPLRCPPADEYMNGRGWLEKPDGSGHLTDPTKLGAALGAGGKLPAEAFG